ncbi:hypothetical protein GUJ93_ZPchr0009g1112 [Zizania palustris]|uniref:Uncharacterized protein n=1 Tax=Zizania palustris TaxID=103762 RepID=A0A8J5V438_ZIZPA|nr:hypothetical protein GUJ93_ZPchr0009g1112 [Zizania palustris]
MRSQVLLAMRAEYSFSIAVRRGEAQQKAVDADEPPQKNKNSTYLYILALFASLLGQRAAPPKAHLRKLATSSLPGAHKCHDQRPPAAHSKETRQHHSPRQH